MKKKKIAFVTDSTAFLTEELRSHPDVFIVPIIVISEGQAFEDGVDLTSAQLYDMIQNSKDVPKTSQPSVGKFQELYKQLKGKYDQAIAIHVSNQLSGTISSSITAKDAIGFGVEVIDSLSISYGMTALIQQGLFLAEQGVDQKEIAKQLREKITTIKNLVLLGNLEQLYKGGRMSGAQFLLGNFLQIKPILTINYDGELGLFERIRTEKKATKRIVELFKHSIQENKVKQVGIMHGNAFEKAVSLKQQLNALAPETDIILGEISSSIAVHAGEGTVALFWELAN